MNILLSFTLFILICVPLVMIAIRLIYKKSIIFIVGSLILLNCVLIAYISFIVGFKGLIHLAWGTPVGISFVFASFFFISNLIRKPLTAVTRNINEISFGNLSIKDDLKAKSNNEVGDLIKSSHRMLDELRYKAGLIRQISNGDFSIEVKLTSEKDELGKSLQLMKKSLNELLGQVDTAVKQVAVSSKQLSSASQSLSDGASAQAGSLEEIISSITQISGQSKQNLDNASEANDISKEAKENAEKGNNQMRELVTAMGKINMSSDEIKKMAEIIDGIASQTNLLALNANVEAVKAGKYGKGFTVIAEEVRALATKSTNAVKETTEMVDNTINNIHIGNDLVSVTAKQLDTIVDSSSKVTVLVSEIVAASKEQANALEQINEALNQIDHVTQSNTANSEESASVAQELSNQAHQLKTMVSRFKFEAEKNTFENGAQIQTELIRKIVM